MAASVLLPDTVRPKKYTLTLEPNFETFEFSGKVVISLEILKPCSELVFHADALEIHSVSLLVNSNHSRSSISQRRTRRIPLYLFLMNSTVLTVALVITNTKEIRPAISIL